MKKEIIINIPLAKYTLPVFMPALSKYHRIATKGVELSHSMEMVAGPCAYPPCVNCHQTISTITWWSRFASHPGHVDQ
eukprot:Skav203998  [mRNA]  locus=scaffold1114:26613:29285:- [translate_table: standard]